MEKETWYFGENDITKNAFHKNKRSVNINEVIQNYYPIVLSDK